MDKKRDKKKRFAIRRGKIQHKNTYQNNFLLKDKRDDWLFEEIFLLIPWPTTKIKQINKYQQKMANRIKIKIEIVLNS